ncbi:hypothetical protein PIB30_069111, partial [Stylosanthes scabra]|nr:hypothetical protein [Stylosanthes scabra]
MDVLGFSPQRPPRLSSPTSSTTSTVTFQYVSTAESQPPSPTTAIADYRLPAGASMTSNWQALRVHCSRRFVGNKTVPNNNAMCRWTYLILDSFVSSRSLSLQFRIHVSLIAPDDRSPDPRVKPNTSSHSFTTNVLLPFKMIESENYGSPTVGACLLPLTCLHDGIQCRLTSQPLTVYNRPKAKVFENSSASQP